MCAVSTNPLPTTLLGQGLALVWSALVQRLLRDPAVTTVQNGPSTR